MGRARTRTSTLPRNVSNVHGQGDDKCWDHDRILLWSREDMILHLPETESETSVAVIEQNPSGAIGT